MKALVIDIETKPSLAYVWRLWDENVSLDQLIEAGEMICWAAKWLGEKKVEFRSVHADGQDVMVQRAWELLEQTDVVIHYNGRNFDVPYLQRAFLEHGLMPPAPYQQIDLYDTVKRQFNFPSNKLEYAGRALLGQGKVHHDGFTLWTRCMNGDEAAWKKMRQYNIADVNLTERLYYVVRPWIRAHPSLAAHTGENICPKCGGRNLTRQGFVTLRTGRYARFQCKDCGSWTRATKRFDKTEITEALNN